MRFWLSMHRLTGPYLSENQSSIHSKEQTPLNDYEITNHVSDASSRPRARHFSCSTIRAGETIEMNPTGKHNPIVPYVENSGIDRRIRRILAYLDRHYDQTVDLKDVASQIDLPPRHFLDKFKKEVGISFPKYLLRIRIHKAAGLLARSEKSVKEIGYEAGFNQPEVFCKTFKRLMGCSPRNFRERMRNS
jgi:two-component system response regulator YesN